MKHIFHVVQDLPTDLHGRLCRGLGSEILSHIMGQGSQDDLQAVVDLLQNVEDRIQESLKLWGDGANHLTAAFKVEESRLINTV